MCVGNIFNGNALQVQYSVHCCDDMWNTSLYQGLELCCSGVPCGHCCSWLILPSAWPLLNFLKVAMG